MRYVNRFFILYLVFVTLGAGSATAQTDFWESTNGPPDGNIISIAFNSEDIFAGTSGSSRGIFRSSDNGDSWTEINTGLTNKVIFDFSVNSNGDIFAATAGGVFRSSDNGDNWSATNNGLINTTVFAVAITNNDDIFAGTFNGSGGVFRSSNNGNTWSQVGLVGFFIYELAVHDNGDIFAGTFAGVYRSSDNGNTWVRKNSGLPNEVFEFAFNSNGDIFAGTNVGMFRSSNSGDSWTAINNGLTSQDAWSCAINSSDDVFAGTLSGGVFHSSNNGDSWNAINGGLTDTAVRALAVSSSNQIFVGTGDGVSRSKPLPQGSVISFVCDMTYEIASGRFDPGDELTVRGDFNGWESTDVMVQVSGAKDWSFTTTKTFVLGQTVQYKFAYETQSGTAWEGGDNRQYTITQTDINNTSATVKRVFDDLDANGFTQQDVTIKFTLDMANAVDINGTAFPSIENVALVGGRAPLQWPTEGWPSNDADKVIFLNDAGVDGDEAAGDNVWSINIVFPEFTVLDVEYKYGANFGLNSNNGANDNEAGFADNHSFMLTADLLSATVRNSFGDMGQRDLEDIILTSDGIADISVSPGSFEFSLNSGDAATGTMTIENSGDGVLNFSIRNEEEGTAGPSNIQKLYWDVIGKSVPNMLYRSDLDGSGIESIFTDDNTVLVGIAVDEARARVYWVDSRIGGGIWSSNLDGSDAQVLISGLPLPFDIAIDPLAGNMYWTDVSAQTISRANLDGSGIEVIIQGTALASQATAGAIAKGETRRNGKRVSASLLDGPWGIALDLLAGKVYWTEQNGNRIGRANLNGTGVETIITTELNGPRGIKLDAEAGKLYFVDSFNQSIKQANLDGTGVETLISFLGVTNMLDIELDIDSQQFYWSDLFLGQVKRADFDGSNVEVLIDVTGPDFIGPIGVGLFLGRGWLTEEPTEGTIQPGSNLEITINVDAANLNAGTYQTNIVIASNDPTQSEVIVPVTLTVAGAPRIVVSHDSLNYGSVNIGGAVTRSLTVSNRGTDLLTVSNISSDNGNYTLEISSFILTPGESQDVEVVFTPTAAGDFPARLTITSDDPDKPNVTVALWGMAALGSPTNLTAAVTQDSVILNWSPPGIGGAIINETEPNNTIAEANPLNFGQIARGTIDPVGDGDLWSFQGTAGQNIIIDVDAQVNGSSLDALVGLFIEEDRDGDGGPDLIAFNDDFEGLDSRIAVTLAESNTYFILIIDAFSGGGSNYFYDMSLTSSSATFTLTPMAPHKPIKKEWTISLSDLAEQLVTKFGNQTKGYSTKKKANRRFARAGSQGLQSYKIYRSTTSPVENTNDNLIGIVDTSTTTFVDADLSPQIYYYIATAMYSAGESTPSNEVSVEISNNVAGIVTVTNTLNSGPGSLRQAILDANANPGLETLNFNIPGTGPHTIQPISVLPIITDPVVIDGYTQPGASPNTNPNTLSNNAVLKIELDGTNAGASTDGLQISAGSSVVRGLVINRFNGDGIYLLNNGGNIIEGVYIGTDITGSTNLGNGRAGISIVPSSPNNTIGGTTNSARCVLSGNRWEVIADSDGNIVAGNFIGIDAAGTSAIGLSSGTGILIQSSKNNVIGGSSAESRNVISGESMGVNIAAVASGNRVQGNFIGTDVSSTVALGNGTGVFIQASFTAGPKNNIIGGPAPGEANVISGNTRGVFIEDDDLVGTTGNLIQGNLIGTDVSGTSALGNVTYGVEVRGASDNRIGGNSAGEGNIIANNGLAGVFVNNTFPGGVPPSGVLILSNSIFSNGGIGIDLRGPSEGSTPNDAGDPDTGPNNLQNFPEIALLRLADNGELVVQFRVDSDPSNSTYPLTIQFFASDASGEGKRLLGDDLYTITDFNQESKLVSLGNATELEIDVGDSIVAIATDFNGNTSEFSTIAFLENVTSVAASESALPKAFALEQNYPNPFNPSTTIQFALPKRSHVTLKLFDITGKVVAVLVDGTLVPGSHKVVLAANGLSSGVYFYLITAGEFTQSRKLTLLK